VNSEDRDVPLSYKDFNKNVCFVGNVIISIRGRLEYVLVPYLFNHLCKKQE